MMEKTYDKTEDIFISIHLSKGGESIIETQQRLEKKKRDATYHQKKLERVTSKDNTKIPLNHRNPSYLDDWLVSRYLCQNGESIAEAKKRLKIIKS